jgi:ABC-type uncharacterized transport system ATPase subunit
MASIVEIKNLTKRYEEFTLRDVSLEIPGGAITGIFGPSGAGKTVVISSHITDGLDDVAESIHFLDDGALVLDKAFEFENALGFPPHVYMLASLHWSVWLLFACTVLVLYYGLLRMAVRIKRSGEVYT